VADFSLANNHELRGVVISFFSFTIACLDVCVPVVLLVADGKLAQCYYPPYCFNQPMSRPLALNQTVTILPRIFLERRNELLCPIPSTLTTRTA
jgi:hypothetical protein